MSITSLCAGVPVGDRLKAALSSDPGPRRETCPQRTVLQRQARVPPRHGDFMLAVADWRSIGNTQLFRATRVIPCLKDAGRGMGPDPYPGWTPFAKRHRAQTTRMAVPVNGGGYESQSYLPLRLRTPAPVGGFFVRSAARMVTGVSPGDSPALQPDAAVGEKSAGA